MSSEKYVWNWPVLPERKGQRVQVALAGDRTGRIRVTFADGLSVTVSRFAVRKEHYGRG